MRGGVQTERSGTDATTPSSGAHTGRISAAKTVDVMPRRSALGSSGAHGDLARNARAVFGSRATSGPRDTRQTVKRPWRRPDRCRRSFCAISPTSWLSSNNCWLSIVQPQPTPHRKRRAGRTVFPRGTAGAASRIPAVLRPDAVRRGPFGTNGELQPTEDQRSCNPFRRRSLSAALTPAGEKPLRIRY
jgi:hypothetical protein